MTHYTFSAMTSGSDFPILATACEVRWDERTQVFEAIGDDLVTVGAVGEGEAAVALRHFGRVVTRCDVPRVGV